jgi:ATP-dependent Lon protease
MKHAIQFSQDIITKYDNTRITLEQQIYLLKVPEKIKEKAMIKLKEIRGKTEDTGTRARQYLEGLLKIPFGVFREEAFLRKRREINAKFKILIDDCEKDKFQVDIPQKEKYANLEIMRYIKTINAELFKNMEIYIMKSENSFTKKQIAAISQYIRSKNAILKSGSDIITYIQSINQNPDVAFPIYNITSKGADTTIKKIFTKISHLKSDIIQIENTMAQITETLDNSIYGHTHAKKQILKVIAQWMNGKSSGYCFGFEGSPGVGKTSLAKNGLSNCMKDIDGSSRPFAFIAVGGSANGSTLEGHTYTYVNSYWGKIVDILMESKCLNPIIYIDELDKVSKTENGKEIIGILTHLIDSTQNDSFQDKYFSGIDIDLSKALFIFSYNDPNQIDSILLDRIHRIKFDNLTTADKLVIAKKYIIPEINSKMGFCQDTVIIADETIEHLIETYTAEPGVRKLKELLFDLFGEINIELLNGDSSDHITVPVHIDEDCLEKKYLKHQQKILFHKINTHPKVGIVNGLWANNLGRGGIIPIECVFFPSSTFFELKLTGLQGDVMKESMMVAKTLAWKMTPLEKKKEWLLKFEETKCQGIHIHCPEGAVSKDGPSAGSAITLALYSLFNNLAINNTVAITGEINLQGDINPIGGLSAKILGGIKSGIKHFIYPTLNQRDFDEFIKANSTKELTKDITFAAVDKIEDVLNQDFI